MAYKQQFKHLDPIDTDVKLPAAVRAAAVKADGLHKDAYVDPNQQQGSNGQEREPEKTTPERPASQAEAGTENVSPPASSAPEEWEHKYTSLKGRYDKQDDTIRQLTGELGNLRAQIEQLRRAPTPEPTLPNPDLSFKKLTQEERDAYGDDFIDVSARAAEEKLLPTIVALQQQIRDLGGKVETVQVTAHQQQTMTMNEILDSKMPNWKKINRDPKFLAWVNLRDPFSGAIRVEMMRQAHAAGDAQRVLNFFNGFLQDEAVVDPAVRQANVTSEGKVPLESLAAPGRAKTSAAFTPPGEKETITRSQIKEFYRLVNQGYYRGNDAEKLRLEQMIFDAERDGRVV